MIKYNIVVCCYVYSAPHTHTHKHTHTHTHKHTHLTGNYIWSHIYKDFIITHYYNVFYHFTNS